jgi:phospholipid/cholesterol/gamma-HCH transport system substrate-binding protein
MRMRTIEISVGGFVLAGILAGLRKRAKVSMAGVTIGRVKDIHVDLEYGEAIVVLELAGAQGSLSIDTGAQILTEGILGARYVNLMAGADEERLMDGDEITDTQGALVLENLIGELVTNLGGS